MVAKAFLAFCSGSKFIQIVLGLRRLMSIIENPALARLRLRMIGIHDGETYLQVHNLKKVKKFKYSIEEIRLVMDGGGRRGAGAEAGGEGGEAGGEGEKRRGLGAEVGGIGLLK